MTAETITLTLDQASAISSMLEEYIVNTSKPYSVRSKALKLVQAIEEQK